MEADNEREREMTKAEIISTLYWTIDLLDSLDRASETPAIDGLLKSITPGHSYGNPLPGVPRDQYQQAIRVAIALLRDERTVDGPAATIIHHGDTLTIHPRRAGLRVVVTPAAS